MFACDLQSYVQTWTQFQSCSICSNSRCKFGGLRNSILKHSSDMLRFTFGPKKQLSLTKILSHGCMELQNMISEHHGNLGLVLQETSARWNACLNMLSIGMHRFNESHSMIDKQNRKKTHTHRRNIRQDSVNTSSVSWSLQDRAMVQCWRFAQCPNPV